MTGRTTARGYGANHQRIRKVLLTEAYGRACHLCGFPMLPGQSLDLDHTADKAGYRGMAHASCNRSEGARRGNAQRNSKANGLKTSRPW